MNIVSIYVEASSFAISNFHFERRKTSTTASVKKSHLSYRSDDEIRLLSRVGMAFLAFLFSVQILLISLVIEFACPIIDAKSAVVTTGAFIYSHDNRYDADDNDNHLMN